MPLPAESDDGLRHVDIDHDAPTETARGRIRDRLEIVFRGQSAECTVDQHAGRFGIDVADDRHFQLVAREHATHIFAHVRGGDTRHRFKGALAFTAVGVIGKSRLPPTTAGEIVRIGGIALKRGHV